jgi:hypothetical protein
MDAISAVASIARRAEKSASLGHTLALHENPSLPCNKRFVKTGQGQNLFTVCLHALYTDRLLANGAEEKLGAAAETRPVQRGSSGAIYRDPWETIFPAILSVRDGGDDRVIPS